MNKESDGQENMAGPGADKLDHEETQYHDDDPIFEQTEADIAAIRDDVSVLGWKATRYARGSGKHEVGATPDRMDSKAADGNSAEDLIPEEIRDILGEPDLLTGENPSRYKKLMCRLVVEYDPQTISDWILVRDICDVYWEIMRFKAAVAAHTSIAAPHLAYQTLKQRLDIFAGGVSEIFKREFTDLISRGYGNGPEDETNTEIILQTVGVNANTLARSTIAGDLDFVERCNRILDGLDKRLRRLMRDIADRKLIAVSSLDTRSYQGRPR